MNNPILVQDYNPAWARKFQTLKNEIWPHIQLHALAMVHVGSTSVPGLAAKPIIDIDIVIEDIKSLAPVLRALSSLGYEHRGNLGIEGREAFRPPVHQIRHNLYVCLKDCYAYRNHILLRDHLLLNSRAREEYSALKKNLAATTDSIDLYVGGKSDFIIKILAEAGLNSEQIDLIRESNEPSFKRLTVNSQTQRAELWDGDRLIKSYAVSTALNGPGCQEGSFCTPTGKLRVASKIGAGLPLGGIIRARVPTGEVWREGANFGAEDLVLTRLLWLEGTEAHNANTFKRYIYLHGTNHESLLGQPASHGCIRFGNKDIIEVFDHMQAGNEVEVI
jgi:GrpB-like predicted nucleotidyltransferase (UPF0157 family)